jgi:hypothetical protein
MRNALNYKQQQQQQQQQHPHPPRLTLAMPKRLLPSMQQHTAHQLLFTKQHFAFQISGSAFLYRRLVTLTV